MPSSYTPNLRLEQQFTGENVNTWGVLLNEVFARLDSSVAGLKVIALTGNYTLTTANGTDDEARNAIIKTTGAGPFTVTIPSVSKMYAWWNACSSPVTVTTGSGATATIASGEATIIMCDAANVKRLISQSMGGNRLTDVGVPTNASDAATKGYADSLAFEAASGQLPGQIGSDGKFLQTVGNVAGWALPTVSSISDYVADQDARAGVINANVTSVANSVTAMGVRVSPLEQGYEIVQPATIANGTLIVDLAGPNTAFYVTLNRNIANVAYINAPPVTSPPTRKTWTLTVIGNATANTVTWSNAAGWTGRVRHNGNTAPTISTVNGTHTTLTQWTEDGGATVRSSKGSET